MGNYTEYIIDYSEGNLSEYKRRRFEMELARNANLRNEYKLFIQINNFMKGKLDLEDIKKDPDLIDADSVANHIIAEYRNNPNKYKNIRDFIESSLEKVKDDQPITANTSKPAITEKPIINQKIFTREELKLFEKLEEIEKEAEELNINQLTAKWVNDWKGSIHKTNSENKVARERINFIKSSLKEDTKPAIHTLKPKTRFIVRVAGYAAAAMLASILLIRTVNQDVQPDQLYTSYYQPFDAFTTVTRNANSNQTIKLADAIAFYKQKDYNKAAAFFGELILENPSAITPYYYAGLSQLELGSYYMAKINFRRVIEMNSDFKKEAQWYLGLAYLKTNDTQQAIEQFRELAKTKGYYQNQAKKILEKLK